MSSSRPCHTRFRLFQNSPWTAVAHGTVDYDEFKAYDVRTTIDLALGYRLVGGWAWLDALYMTVITITTVGFHEVQPLGSAGRLFTMALALGGVFTAFYAAGAFTKAGFYTVNYIAKYGSFGWDKLTMFTSGGAFASFGESVFLNSMLMYLIDMESGGNALPEKKEGT